MTKAVRLNASIYGPRYEGGRVVRYLLQLSERWHCNIWFIDRMKYASLKANLGGVGAFESIPFFFFLHLSGGGSQHD